ncbi:MAG: glycosyltransferase, partial [Succinivibrio sp.]
MLISVIISTYNKPHQLELIFKALNYQTDRQFEVIIADDGSSQETATLVSKMTVAATYPVTHVWQKDEGFRLSRIRNLAAKKAKGEYLIFLDGDCIPRPSFISTHRKLAEKNMLVAGNRILLKKDFSEFVVTRQEPVWTYSFTKWVSVFFKGGINRLHPLIVFPYFQKLRNLKNKWKKARGCNFALFKEDYYKVNGCDESFEGWGYEDS